MSAMRPIPKNFSLVGLQPENEPHYKSAGEVGLANERPIASVLPRIDAFPGFRGTVIPHAPNGISPHNPHNPPSRVVQVDPNEGGAAALVDLSRVTPELSREAVIAAEAHLGPGANKRAKAALAMAFLAESTQGLPQQQFSETGRRLDESTPERSAVVSEVAVPAPVVPVAPPTGGLSAATFSGYQPLPPAPTPAPVPASSSPSLRNLFETQAAPVAATAPAPAPSAEVQPPGFHVHFEMASGEITAPFHHVEVHPPAPGSAVGLLVLGYDDRYRGMRFFPKTTTDPFYVHVDGTPVVYQVESFGIQFKYRHETLAVYAVQAARQIREPSHG